MVRINCLSGYSIKRTGRISFQTAWTDLLQKTLFPPGKVMVDCGTNFTGEGYPDGKSYQE